MNRTEKALDRVWGPAAQRGDQETLANLRLAFEALWPVDVQLTPRQVERLEDQYLEERSFTVTSQRRVIFHSPEAAECAAQRLEDAEDEAVDAAFAAQLTERSEAQERFMERSVRRASRNAVKTLREAAKRVERAAGLAVTS